MMDKMDVPETVDAPPYFGTSSTLGTHNVDETPPTIGQRSLINLPGHGVAREMALEISSNDMDVNSNTSILVPAA